MRRALTTLPPEDVELLEDRYLTGELPDRTVPGPVVTRLARARARSAGKRQAVCQCEIFVVAEGVETLCALAQGTVVAAA